MGVGRVVIEWYKSSLSGKYNFCVKSRQNGKSIVSSQSCGYSTKAGMMKGIYVLTRNGLRGSIREKI